MPSTSSTDAGRKRCSQRPPGPPAERDAHEPGGDSFPHRAGFTVCAPRLPGHGSTGGDFLLTWWRDWLRRAIDEYLELAAVCERVHLVGYSMGALIAILLASRLPVERLAMAAPGVRVSHPLLPFAPFLALFARRVRVRWTPRPHEAGDPDCQALAREYWSWRYLPQAASLRRLQLMARRALRRVTAETLVVQGEHDTDVPLSAFEFIQARIGSSVLERVVLPRAAAPAAGGSPIPDRPPP